MTDLPPPNPYATPNPPLSPADEKLWATLTHVGGIVFGFIAPLIAYLVLRDRGPFVRQHTATALNFQLTLLIGYAVSFVLTFVFIGVLTYFLVWIAGIVFAIIAAIAANNGQPYRYPIAIEFVK
jgi:uncharacterized Tic20 family protein